MAGYIGTVPVPQSTQTRQSFTATASQTSFPTIGYTAGFIDVYLNGVKLVDGTDFTATNGSDGVLTTGAAVDDVLDVVIFDTFDTSSGNFNNSTFTSSTLKSNVTLKNDTEEDSDGGRASKIIYQGEQSGGEITTLAEIQASHDGSADDQKGDLIFRTNDGSDGSSPTERLRLDSAGFVGINESAPSGILHVKGTSAAHGKVIVEAGGSGGSANNNFVEFNKHDGTKLAEIEVGESVTNGGDIIFKTTPTGGSVTNRIRLRHDGGICFGTDNATDNALSDYEIGTWTPVLKSGADTITNSSSVGMYVKVGHHVIVQGSTTRNDSGSYSGHLAIDGLPFNRATATYLVPLGPGWCWVDNGTGNDKIGFVYLANSTALQFVVDSDVRSGRYINASHLNNSRPIYFCATYRAT